MISVLWFERRFLRPALAAAAICVFLGREALAQDPEELAEMAKNAPDFPTKIRHLSMLVQQVPQNWQAWSLRAEAYWKANQFEQAISDASQAIRLDPSQWGPWAIRAAANVGLKRFGVAIADADKAMACDAKQAFPYKIRAEARLQLGKGREALEDLNAAVVVDPHFLSALLLRSQLLLSMDRHEDALRDCEYMESIAPTAAEPRLVHAIVLATQKKTEESLRQAKEAVELAPQDPDVWAKVGELQIDAKRWDEAEASLNKALTLNPNHALAFARRGQMHRLKREYAEAINDCTKALRLDPECLSAYGTRGATYLAKKQSREAIRDLSAALAREPNYGFALEVRARAYCSQKEFDLAIKDVQQMFQTTANDESRAAVHILLGDVCRQKGSLDQSIQVLSEAIRLNPRNADAYFGRANSYLVRRQVGLAIADCDAGLKIAPDDAFGYLLRGVCYLHQNIYQPAKNDLKRAMQTDKDRDYTAHSCANLAEIARLSGDNDAAISYATKALAARPEIAHAMAYTVRGAARRTKEQYHAAIADCTQAIRLDDTFSYAYAERAAALRALRTYDKAIKDCDRAISLLPYLGLAYHERAYAALAKYRGEGIEQKGIAAHLSAIMAGLGGPTVPFELGRTGSSQLTADKQSSDTAAGTQRPYVPEPAIRTEERPEAHPLERAISDFAMLLNLDFNRQSSACGLAQCLCEMDRLEQAKEACDREIAHGNHTADLYATRAMIQYALGYVLPGLTDAQRATRQDAKQPEPKLTAATPVNVLPIFAWRVFSP